jgi:hypothetical protein
LLAGAGALDVELPQPVALTAPTNRVARKTNAISFFTVQPSFHGIG